MIMSWKTGSYGLKLRYATCQSLYWHSVSASAPPSSSSEESGPKNASAPERGGTPLKHKTTKPFTMRSLFWVLRGENSFMHRYTLFLSVTSLLPSGEHKQ